MITDRKVEMFIKFSGDDDMWARTASEKDKQLLTEEDWTEIDMMLRELKMLDGENTAKKYKEEIRERLSATKCSQEILNRLKEIR